MTKMLEKSRKIGFWTLDFLKGSPIKNHFRDISFILGNKNSEASKKRRDLHLKKVLEHARNSVPFYWENVEGEFLERFPVINKSIVKDNFESFKSGIYLDKKKFPVLTSGSTGTPFKLFQDQNKRHRNTADIIYFAKQGGFEIGSRLIFMKVWNNVNRKSTMKGWMENIRPYNIFNYSDEDIKAMLNNLRNDRSRKGIVCFASTCDAIANYLDSMKSEPENFNITSIIANSDSLSCHTKERMEHYFKVPVLSRYSNMECGMMAQQDNFNGNLFNINWASFHVELLHPDKDEPVGLGEVGRVVVTDLFNYCMPLIRYDTGDFATMEVNEPQADPMFKRIEGRKADLIKDTKGKVITPFIVCANMWKYGELRQFQFVQNGEKDYLFRLNPWSRPFLREEELMTEFKGYFGQDANFSIKYTNEIPLMSSGKRKYVVNEMDKDKSKGLSMILST